MKFNKYFVDSSHKVLFDKQAEDKLKEINDQQYLTENGVLSVPRERWELAQQYEEKYWMQMALNEKDDRNLEHMKRFDNYDLLKGKEFNKVIELGSGAFTNLRLIKNICNIKNITLLDPLIKQYVMIHPNCTYKTWNVELVESSIEDYETNDKFDLVVMVNVLEHCQDMNQVFNVVDNILNKNSLFILSEATVKEEHMEHVSQNWYDEGHPLRLVDKFFEKFVESKYKILFKKVFDGLYNNDVRRDFYYILEKE